MVALKESLLILDISKSFFGEGVMFWGCFVLDWESVENEVSEVMFVLYLLSVQTHFVFW